MAQFYAPTRCQAMLIFTGLYRGVAGWTGDVNIESDPIHSVTPFITSIHYLRCVSGGMVGSYFPHYQIHPAWPLSFACVVRLGLESANIESDPIHSHSF